MSVYGGGQKRRCAMGVHLVQHSVAYQTLPRFVIERDDGSAARLENSVSGLVLFEPEMSVDHALWETRIFAFFEAFDPPRIVGCSR